MDENKNKAWDINTNKIKSIKVVVECKYNLNIKAILIRNNPKNCWITWISSDLKDGFLFDKIKWEK